MQIRHAIHFQLSAFNYLIKGIAYHLSKKEDAKAPQCPPEKEAAIMDALKHFQMI